jgi:hypothetical protein
MGYLRNITEEDYGSSTIEYPTICYIGEDNIVRWTPPIGYQILDASEEMFRCSDGDFLVLK